MWFVQRWVDCVGLFVLCLKYKADWRDLIIQIRVVPRALRQWYDFPVKWQMDMGKLDRHWPTTNTRSDSRFAPSQWETALLCTAYGSLRQTCLYISNCIKTDSPWTQITHLWLLPISGHGTGERKPNFKVKVSMTLTLKLGFRSRCAKDSHQLCKHFDGCWILFNLIQYLIRTSCSQKLQN